MALAVLAGCSGQGQAARPASPAAPLSAAAAGQDFAFAWQNGALLVARPAAPLTHSDGLSAKRAALAHCAKQGAQLNPAAFGRLQSGAWAFDGGCQ